MIDDLSFAHDWNYVYNSAYESSIRYDNGYITNQYADPFNKMRYGVTTMDGVACELIAIYNALNKLGYYVPLSKIADYYEHNPGMWNRGKWGTEYWHIGDYFENISCIDVDRIEKNQIDDMLTTENALILSYVNANALTVIHTVMVERTEDGKIKAYNASNGVQNSVEDFLEVKGFAFCSAYIVQKHE